MARKFASLSTAMPARRRRLHNRRPSGCSEIALRRGGQPQHFLFAQPAAGSSRTTRGLSSGQRTGLVQHARIDIVRHLQRFPALNQDSALRAAARPTMMAVGVASPSAHGHAIISTATAFTMAVANGAEAQPHARTSSAPPPAHRKVK